MRRIVILATMAVVIIVPVLAQAYRSGPPAGYTGAPAVGGRNCTSCHSGTANSGPAAFKITAPSTTYAPGSFVPVTVTLGGSLQNAGVNGFQMAAYAAGSNSALAGWTAPATGESRVVSGHISHTQAGSTGRTTWKAYFQTPAAAKNFSLHAAGNDANGDGKNRDDRIYTTSLAMTPGTVNLSLGGVPRTGGSVPINLNAPGDASKGYVLAASFNNFGIPVGNRTVPLFFDDLLVLTVKNLLPSLFQNYQGVLDASGTATATLSVLPNPALKGITLHHAFVVIDAPQPMGIGTISNGLPVTLF